MGIMVHPGENLAETGLEAEDFGMLRISEGRETKVLLFPSDGIVYNIYTNDVPVEYVSSIPFLIDNLISMVPQPEQEDIQPNLPNLSKTQAIDFNTVEGEPHTLFVTVEYLFANDPETSLTPKAVKIESQRTTGSTITRRNAKLLIVNSENILNHESIAPDYILTEYTNTTSAPGSASGVNRFTPAIDDFTGNMHTTMPILNAENGFEEMLSDILKDWHSTPEGRTRYRL